MSATARDMLAGIRQWVEIETHTPDAGNIGRFCDAITRDYAGCGAVAERVPGSEGLGDHLIVRAPWAQGANAPGILILSHNDTVHPAGTVQDFPFRTEGDLAYGPGICDMKGGTYIAMQAVREIAAEGTAGCRSRI